jgi:type 1 glutamine amidotransferase
MLHRILLLVAGLLLTGSFTAVSAADQRPLRALLVTGGCCHNYPLQTQQLTNALAKHTAIEWTVVKEGGNGTRAEISLYDNPDWAKGFDVVVHNECFADTTNQVYIRKITDAHKAGVPAVVIHCAMHTYRSADIDDWREFLGVTSKRHDHQSKYPVKLVEPVHPILKGVAADWVTPMDELYVIEKVWPNAKALATSVSERDGKTYPVVWINQYGKARVFGTTYGHSDDVWRDPNFLKMVSRGTLWAAGRLND